MNGFLIVERSRIEEWLGYNSDNASSTEIADTDVHVIGDANKVSNLLGAIWQAYELAINI